MAELSGDVGGILTTETGLVRPHAHSGSSGDSCSIKEDWYFLQRRPQGCFHSVSDFPDSERYPSLGHRLSPASTPSVIPYLPLCHSPLPQCHLSSGTRLSSSGSELWVSGCPCQNHASASICIADSFLFLALSSSCTFCPRLVILFDVILLYFHHLPLSKINLFFSLARSQQNASSGRAGC